jgi:hypothetical protein
MRNRTELAIGLQDTLIKKKTLTTFGLGFDAARI